MIFRRISEEDYTPTRSLQRRRRAARATIAVLPTLFTLGNLLCGGASIFLASRPSTVTLPWGWSPLTFAAAFIFLGMLFDGLDGRIARLTRSTSDLGEQLDSMADMVTFGVAPAFLAVQLAGVKTPFFWTSGDIYFDRIALVFAAIYVACTALRLARFNIEVNKPTEADHMSFKGLPSPGAAGTVASLVLLHQQLLANKDPNHWSIDASSIGMMAILLLAAFAMVSRLRYAHLLNRYFRGRARFTSVTKLVVVLLLLSIYPQAAVAFGFVAYAVSAPALWAWQRLRRSQHAPPTMS